MITSKNKNKITGLNQFPVRNEHYQRNTVKRSIPALKCIALLCSTDGFGFVQDCLTMQLDFSMFTG